MMIQFELITFIDLIFLAGACDDRCELTTLIFGLSGWRRLGLGRYYYLLSRSAQEGRDLTPARITSVRFIRQFPRSGKTRSLDIITYYYTLHSATNPARIVDR